MGPILPTPTKLPSPTKLSAAQHGWRALVAKYQQPDARKSIFQIANSFGGLFVCWALMLWSLQVGYWLTLLIAIPAAGFLVRIFIIQHDCGHGAFFAKRRANDSVGALCSLFTLIPYKFWRKCHAIHHAHHADLDERGIGDVWTMTTTEFLQASRWKQLVYRFFRNPFFLFGIAPTIHFVLLERFPISAQATWHNGERASVWWLNLALALFFTAASLIWGVGAVILVHLPIIMIAATVGTWLFYVQHQFERTYWEHTPQWDFTLAALQGSSYYQLPAILQWFTGNIGFHHIHHLSPRIPNYHLQACHESHPLFRRVVHLTLRSSLKTIWLTLWDENRQRLITFREALHADPLVAKVPGRLPSEA
jgi:omega-6 fatty acid desaturase (delta-12 desaturase)